MDMKKILLLFLVQLLILGASAEVVTTPKGQPRAYSHNVYVSSDMDTWGWVAGKADTVYFDGNDVYFKDFVPIAADGCYLKGTITSGDSHNGTIEIKFSQETSEYSFELYELESTSTSPDVLTLTISNDTIRQADNNLYVAAAYLSDSYEAGGASRVSYIPLPEGGLAANPNVVPAGAALQKYMFKVNVNGTATQAFAGVKDVYFSGNEVYITNIGGGTLKGTIVGNKISIPMPSYLGVSSGLYTYLDLAYTYTKDGTPYYGVVDNPSTLTMTYDAATGTISCDTVLLVTNGHVATVSYYNHPVFEKFNAPHYSVPSTAKDIVYQMTKKDVYGEQSTYKTKVTVARDGNDFYFKNLNYQMDDSCAMKGTLEADGKIHVKLPQYVGIIQDYDWDKDEYYDVKYYVGAGYVTDDDYFGVDINKDEATFTYDAATGEIIGEGITILFNEAANLSDALYEPDYVKMPDVVTVPEDAVESSYIYSTTPWTFQRNRTSARIARSGNDFYFKDFDAEWYDPEEAIIFKGTLNAAGDKIIVPVPQYVGGKRALYLHSALANPADTTYSAVDEGGQIEFNYDAKTGVINSDALLLLVRDGRSTDAPYEEIYKPTFTPYTAQAGTPVAPLITGWSYNSNWGQYVMQMYLPEVDTEGHFLNPDNMTYRIFFDGSTTPYVFTTDAYYDFDYDISDIPFRYTGASFGVDFADERLRNVWLNDSPTDSIGLQVVYTFEGQEYVSDTFWYHLHEANKVNSPSAAVVTRKEYFDLSGRRVNSNATGLVIEKTYFADGKVKVSKRLK